MSPEQAMGEPVDRRTDVFALGTTLWEIACDRRLFKRSDDGGDAQSACMPPRCPDPTLARRRLSRSRSGRCAAARPRARDGGEVCDRRSDGSRPRSVRRSCVAVSEHVVAEVMNELFAQEKAHANAWMTDASTRSGSRPSQEPLKRRSTFLEDEGDVRPSRAGRDRLLPPASAPRPATPLLARSARSGATRRLRS